MSETTPSLVPNQDPGAKRPAPTEGLEPRNVGPNAEPGAHRGPTGFVPDDAIGSPTWAEAWEEFREEKLLQPCKPQTIDQYGFALRPLRRWVLQTLRHDRLELLTEADARAYLAHVKEYGADGKRSIGQGRLFAIYRHLNVFFRWLAERGYATHNPFANIRIDKPRDDDPLFPELTPDQIARLLSVIDTTTFAGHRDRLLLLYLYTTAARITEALSVQVREELARGEVTFVGKGEKERQAGLAVEFRRELPAYHRARNAHLASIGRSDSRWLFPNKDGDRLGAHTVWDRLKVYKARAGIEDARCSPHDFRHSYALAHQREKGDSLELMHILGHSTLAMTNRYAKQAARDVRGAMQKWSPLASIQVPPLQRSAEGGAASRNRGRARRPGSVHVAS
ncbi:MAG: hypothetical protein FJX75_05010 [Armatimonadetes bacterium]|nr:hypothetical protein [Armatimonadota bacterium]